MLRACTNLSAGTATSSSMSITWRSERAHEGTASGARTSCFPAIHIDDRVSDRYLEHHHWGIPHLDAASFRLYMPALLDYCLRHIDEGCHGLRSRLLVRRRSHRGAGGVVVSRT
ncbi:DUF6714 family protein [Ramlibacter tataouinensis]|uniref:DUF6714 family protein n=1 Tax=Ramlibacter tataouinensis TaxID=94132 RepID=UPI0033657A19